MVAMVIIMVADILLTLLFGQIIGPAAFRFSHYGLPGTLFRAPFYLLRLYIGMPRSYFSGSGSGIYGGQCSVWLSPSQWLSGRLCPSARQANRG